MAPTQQAARSARPPTTLRPFAFSLDVLLPLIDLREQRRWAPAMRDDDYASPAGGVQLLIWFEALWGWFASLALIAMVSGLADRDRRI